MRCLSVIILCISMGLMSPDVLPGNKKEIWKVQSDYALKLYKEKKYRKALEIEKSSLEIAEKTFGKGHPNHVSNLNNIGEIYRVLKDGKNAEKYFKKAVSAELRREMKTGVSVRYISNLARFYESVDRYGEAEKYRGLAVKVAGELFGKNSGEYASELSCLGRIYRKLEEYKKAGSVLMRALEINLGNGDRECRQNVMIYGNLGMNFDQSGDFEKAERYFMKAVSLSKSVYGENDPETARNINNLSALYYKFSKYREARELTEKFIELNRKQKYVDRKMEETGLSNLAAVYYGQKLYRAAEEKFLSLLEDREKRYGKGHRATASTLRKLGILYFSWNKYKKSRSFLERSFAVEPSPGFHGDLDFFEGRSTLGLVYEKLGMDTEALDLYRASLRMKAASMRGDSHRLLSALNDLAIFYFRAGRDMSGGVEFSGGLSSVIRLPVMMVSLSAFKESGNLLGRGMRIVNRFPGKSFPASLTTVNYYMEYLLGVGKVVEAEDLYSGIVKQYRSIFGESHLNMSNVLEQFAAFYRKRGNLDQALQISREVVEIYRKNGLADDIKAVESLRNLGNVLILRHQHEEALAIFIKKLRIMENKFGSDSVEILNDVYELGDLHLIRRDMKKAGELFLRVLKIWDTHQGDDGADTVSFLKDISGKLNRAGFRKQWRRVNTRIRSILRREAAKKALNR